MVMLVLFGTVVEHVHDEAREPVPLVSPSEYEQLLPTPAELYLYCLRYGVNKAAGEDCLPPSLFRFCPGVMTSLFYPVVLCALCLLIAPAQWRGGCLKEFFKQKGSPAELRIIVTSHLLITFLSFSGGTCGGWCFQVLRIW